MRSCHRNNAPHKAPLCGFIAFVIPALIPARHAASSAASAQLSLPEAYDTLLTSGLKSDPAQRDLCYALEDLRSRVNAHREASQHYAAELADWRRTCARLQAEADAAEARAVAEAASEREKVAELNGQLAAGRMYL